MNGNGEDIEEGDFLSIRVLYWAEKGEFSNFQKLTE